MPKILIVAEVEDAAKWEAGFRTHGDVFKTYHLTAPVDFTTSGNMAALCMETSNVEAFMKEMQSPVTRDAMASDGVKAATVKFFVLDKDLKV